MTAWTGNYQLIIEPTTAEATSSTFSLPQDGTNLTIICIGLSGSETTEIQILNPITNTFVNYLPYSGWQGHSSTINTLNMVNTHGVFRLYKPVTVNSVGATVQQSKGK